MGDDYITLETCNERHHEIVIELKEIKKRLDDRNNRDAEARGYSRALREMVDRQKADAEQALVKQNLKVRMYLSIMAIVLTFLLPVTTRLIDRIWPSPNPTSIEETDDVLQIPDNIFNGNLEGD